jgi:hypothetical protein
MAAIFKMALKMFTFHPKNRPFSLRKLNSTFFHRFLAARQVSEIVVNESSKSTKNAPIE